MIGLIWLAIAVWQVADARLLAFRQHLAGFYNLSMGNSICRSVSLSTNSRRSDLKDSRFDRNASKKSNASRRGQVQPMATKLATVNTSFLNHTKSIIKTNGNHSDGARRSDDFLEELDCNYCKDTILNGAIANNIVNNNLPTAEDSPKVPLTPFLNSSSTVTVLPGTPPNNLGSVFSATFQHQVPAIVHPYSDATNQVAGDVCGGSESDLFYRSVSTIPIASEKGSDTEEDADMNEGRFSNTAKCGSLDEGIDFKLKRNHHMESMDNVSDKEETVVHCLASPERPHQPTQKCNFCDFVKNGSARSWNDLDKDVSMLMETVDKLSSMIVEKEFLTEKGTSDGATNEKLFKIKDLKNQFGQVDSLDDSDEIVEEKKVSLSFLEKLHGFELKEKVQKLRNKRRIGISLMKTSHGKRLMVFSDGQNTYQIQGELTFLFLLAQGKKLISSAIA